MRRSVVPVVAGLVLLLAACGDGSDDTEVAGVVFEHERDASDGSDDAGRPPATLPDASSELGAILGFGDDGVQLGGQGPIEAAPRAGFVTDVLWQDGSDRVRCRTTLQASDDRPLAASGALSVELVLEGRDDEVERRPQQLVEVDAELDAGDREKLPLAPWTSIEPDALSGVYCDATFEAR